MPDGKPSERRHVLDGDYDRRRAARSHQGSRGRSARSASTGSGPRWMRELLGGALDGHGRDRGEALPLRQRHARLLRRSRKWSTSRLPFDGEIARYTDFVRAARPIARSSEVLMPGEPERRTARRAHQVRNSLAGRYLGGDSEHVARSWRQRSHRAGHGLLRRVPSLRSAAKQSRTAERADCFVAPLLAMTAGMGRQRKDHNVANKVKDIWTSGKAVVNAWLAIPFRLLG